jgi:hypothetical protein
MRFFVGTHCVTTRQRTGPPQRACELECSARRCTFGGSPVPPWKCAASLKRWFRYFDGGTLVVAQHGDALLGKAPGQIPGGFAGGDALVPILGTRSVHQDHQGEGALGPGHGEGAGQDPGRLADADLRSESAKSFSPWTGMAVVPVQGLPSFRAIWISSSRPGTEMVPTHSPARAGLPLGAGWAMQTRLMTEAAKRRVGMSMGDSAGWGAWEAGLYGWSEPEASAIFRS